MRFAAVCFLIASAGLTACQSSAPILIDAHPDRVERLPQDDGTISVRLKGASHVYQQQKSDVWCWAACAAMLHGIRGNTVSQEDIVARVQGMEAQTPEQQSGACYFEVVKALTPELDGHDFEDVLSSEWDEQQKKWRRGSFPSNLDLQTTPAIQGFVKKNLIRDKNPAIEDLISGHGALVALSEPDADTTHVYVLIGANYHPPATDFLNALDKIEELEKNPIATLGDNVIGLFSGTSPKKEAMKIVAAASSWRKEYEDVVSDENAQMAMGTVGLDRYRTVSVVLLDPWEEDAEAALKTIDGKEFARTVDYVLSASAAQEIAERWTKSIEIQSKQVVDENLMNAVNQLTADEDSEPAQEDVE